ncbi:MAG: hypothetical protein AAGK32_09870 [Actinomycetota bacterium]
MDDGVYEAMVVDAVDRPDGFVMLDLVVTAGALKGEVVSVAASGPGLDAVDVLGLPARLTVTDGRPHVDLEP